MRDRQRRRVSPRTVVHWAVNLSAWIAAIALWATVHGRQWDGPTETAATLLGVWTAALWLGRQHGRTRVQLRVVEEKVDDIALDNVIPIRRDDPNATQVLAVVGRAPVVGGAAHPPPRGLSYTAGDHTLSRYVKDLLGREGETG